MTDNDCNGLFFDATADVKEYAENHTMNIQGSDNDTVTIATTHASVILDNDKAQTDKTQDQNHENNVIDSAVKITTEAVTYETANEEKKDYEGSDGKATKNFDSVNTQKYNNEGNDGQKDGKNIKNAVTEAEEYIKKDAIKFENTQSTIPMSSESDRHKDNASNESESHQNKRSKRNTANTKKK